MNVTVINFKKISKSFVSIIFSTIILIMFIKVLFTNIIFLQNFFTFEKCSRIYTCFFDYKTEFDGTNTKLVEYFCPIIALTTYQEKDEVKQIINESQTTISKDVTTEAVSEKNISESYNLEYKGVKIKNQSDCDLSEDILNPESLELINTKKILIYHTHTCESYTSSEKYNYTMTGNYRTTDNNYNMVRVGKELKDILENKGFEVIQNSTCHDYPSYSGSYDRSMETVNEILSKNPDIQIVIDLHRDAVGDGASYGPTVKVNGDKVAQMMFVIGTNGGGLDHPKWDQNLKTAIKIQSKANEIYPGLFRPIIVRNSRYNQNVALGAVIIEVGATGNTLEECLLSMQCLANVLEETF